MEMHAFIGMIYLCCLVGKNNLDAKYLFSDNFTTAPEFGGAIDKKRFQFVHLL